MATTETSFEWVSDNKHLCSVCQSSNGMLFRVKCKEIKHRGYSLKDVFVYFCYNCFQDIKKEEEKE